MSNIHIPGHSEEKSVGKHHLLRSITLNRGNLSVYACAECLFSLYKDEFIYHEGWYQYKNKWIRMKECVELRRHIPDMKVFMDEEIKKSRLELTKFSNELRDAEEYDEKDVEHIKVIKTNIHALETKRTHLLNARNQLDKTAFKNNIIKECRDLFLDTTGIIVRSNEDENNEKCLITPGCTKDIKKEKESPIKLFIKFLVTKDVDFEKEDVILLSSIDILSKFKQFLEINHITYEVNAISFIKRLKNMCINGIRTGIHTMTCNKTEFIKKDIKIYLGLLNL